MTKRYYVFPGSCNIQEFIELEKKHPLPAPESFPPLEDWPPIEEIVDRIYKNIQRYWESIGAYVDIEE